MAEEFDWHEAISASARYICHAAHSEGDRPCPACMFNGSRFIDDFLARNRDALLRELRRQPRQQLRCEIRGAGETRH